MSQDDLNETANAMARLMEAVDQLEAALVGMDDRLREAARYQAAMRTMADDRDRLAEALARAEGRLTQAEAEVRAAARTASADAARLLDGETP